MLCVRASVAVRQFRRPILAIIKIHSKYNVYFLSHLDLFSLISLKSLTTVRRLYYNVRAWQPDTLREKTANLQLKTNTELCRHQLRLFVLTFYARPPSNVPFRLCVCVFSHIPTIEQTHTSSIRTQFHRERTVFSEHTQLVSVLKKDDQK